MKFGNIAITNGYISTNNWLVTPKPYLRHLSKKILGLLTVFPLGLPLRTSYVAKHTETRVPTANVSD